MADARANIGQSVHATMLSRAQWYIIITPPENKTTTKATILFGQIDAMHHPRDRRIAASLLRKAAKYLEELS